MRRLHLALHRGRRSVLSAALLLVLAAEAGRRAQAADARALEARTAAALYAALATVRPSSEPTPALRTVSLTGARLTLDLTLAPESLTPGSLAFERLSRRLHVAAADVLRAELESFEIVTLIDGQPLDRLLAATPPLAVVPFRAQPAPPLSPPGTPVRARSLAARRIAVSPGHGYYLNGTAWVLQRGFWQGIVEDFVNHDMITVLSRGLA
ncbi:MAG: hypothetical protein JNL92_20470, partial [Opitutaceae bacterium]|nr:hypothetical protein [Opitutaceae bacterium]